MTDRSPELIGSLAVGDAALLQDGNWGIFGVGALGLRCERTGVELLASRKLRSLRIPGWIANKSNESRARRRLGGSNGDQSEQDNLICKIGECVNMVSHLKYPGSNALI